MREAPQHFVSFRLMEINIVTPTRTSGTTEDQLTEDDKEQSNCRFKYTSYDKVYTLAQIVYYHTISSYIQQTPADNCDRR